MIEYISFWFDKAAVDLIIFFGIAALVIAVTVAFSLLKMIEQRRCKHIEVFENSACHAMCRDCRADLGFIDTWRNRQPDTTESGK